MMFCSSLYSCPAAWLLYVRDCQCKQEGISINPRRVFSGTCNIEGNMCLNSLTGPYTIASSIMSASSGRGECAQAWTCEHHQGEEDVLRVGLVSDTHGVADQVR